jgi:hypothetical protein
MHGKINPEKLAETKTLTLTAANSLDEFLEAAGLGGFGRSSARLARSRHWAWLGRYRLRQVLGAVLELGLS